MPEPVSNNAVATNGNYVYSFMGIDTTKLYSGIHLKGFRYDIANNTWDTIPPVPDALTRIAGSAVAVKGKIYLIGGYHVYSSLNEISSKRIFIYDPDSNSYTQGVNLKVATDDQVQAVWRDSLIYVITGWSNTLNIPTVQIYDPALDTCYFGTATPGNTNYEAFGASGAIIGDTIYYAGGVKDSAGFTIVQKLRIGVINPNYPDSISWSYADHAGATLYRSGASVFKDEPIWIGGAGGAYNFDGLDYGTGLGVEPLVQIMTYDIASQSFVSYTDVTLPSIMDIRGVARIDTNKFIIAGGMGPGQQVSAKTYLFEYVIPPGFAETEDGDALLWIYPNPASKRLQVHFTGTETLKSWKITDPIGRVVDKGIAISNNTLPVSSLPSGLYMLEFRTDKQAHTALFIINQ